MATRTTKKGTEAAVKPKPVVVIGADGVEHKMKITRFSASRTEGAVQCEADGCRFYEGLSAAGVADPALHAARFRLHHGVGEPGDVAAADAADALAKAVSEAESLIGTLTALVKGLADPDKRLGAADWWDDHTQGLSYTARQVEGRLQVYLALSRAAHTERVVAEFRSRAAVKSP